MISSVRNIICLFFVLSCLMPFVFSIKCFDCRSDSDSKCNDPFDNSTVQLTDCKHEKGPGLRPSMCRKIKQKVNGLQIIIRGCVWNDEFSSACFSTSNELKEDISCVTCENDACNAAYIIAKNVALLIPPLVLLLFK